jgi:hypothetical protein
MHTSRARSGVDPAVRDRLVKQAMAATARVR